MNTSEGEVLSYFENWSVVLCPVSWGQWFSSYWTSVGHTIFVQQEHSGAGPWQIRSYGPRQDHGSAMFQMLLAWDDQWCERPFPWVCQMHALKAPSRSGGTTPEYSHHTANGTHVYGLSDSRDFKRRLWAHFDGDWPLYKILQGLPHQDSQDYCPSPVQSLHRALQVPGPFTQVVGILLAFRLWWCMWNYFVLILS